MSDEQLPHLETFARAAELGGFSAAARALGLTQAAVSQRVQALEKVLGLPMFRRTGGRAVLTEAGQRLYGYAQRILELHREALHEVAGRQVLLAGELSLAASSIPGEYFLPALLSTFRQKHAHVQVPATVTDTREVLQQVEQGDAQLGLVGGKAESPHLEHRCFASDTLAVVVRADDKWGRRKRVPLEQVCRRPMILREPGSGSRWCLEQALAQAGKSLRDVQVVLELGSNEAIKEAVLRGLGLTVLSTHAIQKEVQAGQLHAVQIVGLPLVRDMFVVWDRRRALPIPARLFLDLLPAPPEEASHP